MRLILFCLISAQFALLTLVPATSAEPPIQRLEQLQATADKFLAEGNLAGALETFRKIASEAQPGSSHRIQAEAFFLLAKMGSGQDCVEDAIGLLVQSSTLADPHRQLRDHCQDIGINAIVMSCLATQAAQPPLPDTLDQIEGRMIDEGVPVGIAKLIQFADAMDAQRSGRDDRLEETLKGLENVMTGDRVTAVRRAQYWNLWADLHQRRRHFADAFDACGEFERYAQLAGLENAVATAREQSALVALRIGDYAEARRLLESTAALHEAALPAAPARLARLKSDVEWRVNLAKSLEGSNEYVSAQRQLETASKSLAGNRPELAESVVLVENNLGLNHYLQGEFDLAAKLMASAKETIRASDAMHVRLGEADVNAGWVALAKNNPSAAAAFFADAAECFATQLSKEHPRYAEALTYQARIGALQGHNQQARHWIEEAEELVYLRVCRDLASSGSTQDRIAIVQEARVHPESIAWPGTIDTFLELAPKLNIRPDQQYQMVLRWKGLIQRFDRHDDVEGEEARLLNAKLREALFRKSVPRSKRRAWRQEIEQHESQLRQIQRTMRSKRTREANAASVSIADVAATLQAGDLFLDIFQYRTFRQPSKRTSIGSAQQYAAFALRADGQVERLDLGSAGELDAAVIRWCNTITERQNELSADEWTDHQMRLETAAKKVARLVQQPILAGDAAFTRLLIRADGATHLIPWGALPGTDGKKYWIENIRLQICDGAGPSPVAGAKRTRSLLVVGGVDFGDLKQYQELQGSMEEKQQVARKFQTEFAGGNVTDLEGRAADEAALVRAMPGKDFVHLATHGFYRRGDESNAFAVAGATSLLQTGLVVAAAGGEDSTRDQYLTAAEIGEIDLAGTSLVTLSACESSLGQTLAGQGVQGMFGSFHAAGAARVIGTLWIIDDEATVKMTDRFYHHLWSEGLRPADALRAAQIEMIATPEASGASLISHPYAWAAFICSAK